MFGGENVNIEISFKETAQLEAQSIPLDIIYEDDDIIIINKPDNLVVHPGAGNTSGTLLNALLHYFPPIINIPRAGIVHRLDKATTGLMVIAKTILAQNRLIKSFQEKKVIREYEAIVNGNVITDGTVNQPIARHATKRTHMAVHQFGKSAITHYRIVERFRAHTHLYLSLETGRTHQIRVHMAYINHPLVGDPIYGDRTKYTKGVSKAFADMLYHFNRQALHATFLQLYHPITSTKMEWNSLLPRDMTMLIAALKEDTKLFTK